MLDDDEIGEFKHLTQTDTTESLRQGNRILQDVIDDIESGKHFAIESPSSTAGTGFSEIRLIAERFHRICKSLRKRHCGKQTLDVQDEYDAQDLLRALLQLYFDDIRPEEHTPSYAGKSSRVDFLLKDARIAIEVKMTRPKLADKKIGEELSLDIAKYQAHPDVNSLICFVYDPDGYIQNPTGLENDLNKRSSDDLAVSVLIRPTN